MATNRSFQSMLNEYLPNRLLKEELLKRNWVLQNVQRDDSWAGGQVIVPFKGSQASSIAFGALTASNDVAEDVFVRGTIADYKEVWGTMKWNHRDLMDHEGKIPEATFIKLVSETVDDFSDYMNEIVSIALTVGEVFARAEGDGQAGGTIVVNRIDRFKLGQKVSLIDNNTAAAFYYVIAINVDTKTVTLSASRGGSAADISAYTVAQSARFLHQGGATDSFISLRSALLSAANGGSATLHGQTKTAYPFLQAVNESGADMTAANILDKLFQKFTRISQKARGGKCNTILMSLSNLGLIMQLIQIEKGPYHVAPGDKKALEFGWHEITLGSTTGQFLRLVGIQEMDDDVMYVLDLKAMTFRSKGFFKKRKAPDGREYFEVRNTSGYEYLVDMCLFGELEVSKPNACGVIYGINLASAY
jgi:hypothetical protein